MTFIIHLPTFKAVLRAKKYIGGKSNFLPLSHIESSHALAKKELYSSPCCIILNRTLPDYRSMQSIWSGNRLISLSRFILRHGETLKTYRICHELMLRYNSIELVVKNVIK